MPALPTAKRQRGQSHFRCAPEGAVPFSLARNLGQSPGAKIGTVPASLARCYGDGGAVEGLLACVEALTRGGSLWAVSFLEPSVLVSSVKVFRGKGMAEEFLHVCNSTDVFGLPVCGGQNMALCIP